MIKKKNELAAAKPTEQAICDLGFLLSLRNTNELSPMIIKALHVKMNIDELPIIKSDNIIDVIGTIKAAFQPITIAAITLTVVTSSRL